MSEPLMIDAVFYGGPVDGAELRVPETSSVLLAAVRDEIHGYAWSNARQGGRWIYRYQRLLARTAEGANAAAVLRAKGHPVVEITETKKD